MDRWTSHVVGELARRASWLRVCQVIVRRPKTVPKKITVPLRHRCYGRLLVVCQGDWESPSSTKSVVFALSPRLRPAGPSGQTKFARRRLLFVPSISGGF